MAECSHKHLESESDDSGKAECCLDCGAEWLYRPGAITPWYAKEPILYAVPADIELPQPGQDND